MSDDANAQLEEENLEILSTQIADSNSLLIPQQMPKLSPANSISSVDYSLLDENDHHLRN